MKNVVIGTAGHIDHGKTTLIKALTGRDTDRLKEEKERGISIDLGFTYFDLPSGKRAGIIDVPGHEKFIKNMLAGVGGIDVVILVIAADEGVMPQTKEHLNILKLLQVKKGVVALTKKDLVDDEWLNMIALQVREELKGSFLENVEIIPVSSKTGEGLNELISEIDKLTEIIEFKDSSTAFRLPIDRVFSVKGFGTIVTGTLISGTITEGDRAIIYPTEIESRIRTIHVHDKSVTQAFAGQRVAVNIAGIKLEDVNRGDVLAKEGSIESTTLIDAKIELLPDSPFEIHNQDRLRIYHGTAEVMCRVILLDKDEIKPGESGFVQLKLENELACCRGDRFILRFYSPMLTIGGGVILTSNAQKRKRYRQPDIDELIIKENGDPKVLIESFILHNSPKLPNKMDISELNLGNNNLLSEAIDQLKLNGKIYEITQGEERYYVHTQYLESVGEQLVGFLADYHKKNSLSIGIAKETIRAKFFEDIKPKQFDLVLDYFIQKRQIKLEKQLISIADFKPNFNESQKQIRNFIIKRYNETPYNPPKLSDIQNLNKYSANQIELIQNAMIDMEELIKIDDDIIFLKSDYLNAREIVINYIKDHGSIQLGEFRDLLKTSRKYAVALLDCFDREKLTIRVDDKRILFT